MKDFKKVPVPKLRLTEQEWKEVQDYWSGLECRVGRNYFEVFKALKSFDKKFLPEDIYVSLILPSLNPRKDSYTYVNKGLYDLLFKEIPQPVCYVKNISGVYWQNDKILDDEQVCTFLSNKIGQFIIKPSLNSFGGANVKKVNLAAIEPIRKKQYVKDLLLQYKSDFVIQEVVQQHSETAQFNPESLNTFRICSLVLNGKLSILTRLLRCGQNGSVIDNGFAGGIMIPVLPDGRLSKYGVDHNFKKYERSSNGIVFDGICLNHYSKLEAFIAEYHRFFPTCHLIAWDLAIDKNGDPLMIEVNLVCPGITEEQGTIGPFFGDRTDEVIEYVKTHQGKLNIVL